MKNQVDTVLMPHETQITNTPKLWKQISLSSGTNSLFFLPLSSGTLYYLQSNQERSHNTERSLRKGTQISPTTEKNKKKEKEKRNKAQIPSFYVTTHFSTNMMHVGTEGQKHQCGNKIPEHCGQTLK